MSETRVINTIARERVENLALSHGEPSWLKDHRLSTWETYLQTPMPTTRDEEWHGTDISALDLRRFARELVLIVAFVDSAAAR